MNPKKILTIFCLLVLYGMNSSAINREDYINIHYKGNHDDHFGIPFVPMDMPDVYYNNVAQEIIIDKKVITIAEPIKQVGEYTAQARLHREVKADIKLNVVAE